MTINEFNNLLFKFNEYLNLDSKNAILDIDSHTPTHTLINIPLIIKEVINDILHIWIMNDEIIPRITLDLLISFNNFADHTITECLLEKYVTTHSSIGMICKKCNDPIKKHILEKDDNLLLKSQLLNAHPNSQKVLNKFDKWMTEYIGKKKTKGIVYILDGGNIGHSLYTEFSFKAIIKIIDLIKNKYQESDEKDQLHILLILHKRHKEALEKNMLLEAEDNILSIYLTPPNHNDDLFWMLSALMLENSFIISNDLMRDHHVNKLDETLFNRWKKTHMVTYDIHTNEFNYPTEYTIGIQKSLNGLHIPVSENNNITWFCLSK